MKKINVFLITVIASFLLISCGGKAQKVKTIKSSNYMAALIMYGEDEEFVIDELKKYSPEKHQIECDTFYSFEGNGIKLTNVSPLEIALIKGYDSVVQELLPYTNLSKTSDVSISIGMSITIEQCTPFLVSLIVEIIPDAVGKRMYAHFLNHSGASDYLAIESNLSSPEFSLKMASPLEFAFFLIKDEHKIYHELTNFPYFSNSHKFFLFIDNEGLMTTLAEVQREYPDL
ncbi:MAG: hypothetical protein MST05_04570 [Treponema sp.]|nr:hypothetical protein [Treponema sp.]